MPAITGSEIAKIRAKLEKSGHLGRAQARGNLTSSQKLQAQLSKQKQAPPPAKTNILGSIKQSFLRGDFTESLTASLGALASNKHVIKQIEARDTYVNYMYNRYRKTSDPDKQKSILKAIENAQNSKSAEERFITEMTEKQRFSLALGSGIEVGSLLPIGASLRAGSAAKIAMRSAGVGTLTGTENALAGIGKGEGKVDVAKRFGVGFAGGTVLSGGLSFLGRLGSRAMKATREGGEAISKAKLTAKNKPPAPKPKTTAVSHSDFLSSTAPRKLTFKTTQRGGGVKIPITVKKTAKLISPELDNMFKARKGLDPDNAFMGKVLEEMDVAVNVGAGKRIVTEAGETLRKESGFGKIDWIPDDLKSTKLFNQVMDDITSGSVPKAGTKRGDLYEIVQNRVNELLEIPDKFDLTKVKNLKPGTKTLKDGTKLTLDKQGNVTSTKTVGKKVGQGVEFEGKPKLLKPKKASKSAETLKAQLEQERVKGTHEVGEVDVRKVELEEGLPPDPDTLASAKAKMKAAQDGQIEFEAIHVDSDGIVRDGAHRVLAARAVGIDKLPAVMTTTAKVTNKGKITSRVRLRNSNVSTEDVQKSVNKIGEALRDAKKLGRIQEGLRTAERSKRAAKLKAIGEDVKSGKLSGEAGHRAKLSSLKGELPKVTFESIKKNVKQADMENLFVAVEKNEVLQPYEKIAATDGLLKMFDGELPQKSQVRLLEEVFGSEFVNDLMTNKEFAAKMFSTMAEVLNIPRALMASADVSAPLRQGVFLAPSHPIRFAQAFGRMFKYFFSEDAYKGLLKEIKARPNYGVMRENKLAITEMGTDLAQREEAFMSNIAENLPIIGKVVKASSRAYSGFLDRFRADVFDDLYNKAVREGIPQTSDKAVKDIAKFVNSATGRGELGMFEEAAPLLNSVFFSPRLLASRINLVNPRYYMKLDKFARKEALKSLFTFVSAGATVGTIAKMNGAEVDLEIINQEDGNRFGISDEMLSADFAKIKVGNTRFDIWGGFQQYPKILAQMIAGKSISSTTGKTTTFGEGYKPTNRLQILGRFFQMKEAPVPSFIFQMLEGKNAIGEDFDADVEVANRMIPIVMQDAYDLYKEGGLDDVPLVIPALFGVGVQTYGTKEFEIQRDEKGDPDVDYKGVSGLGEDIVDWIKQTPVNEAVEHIETYQEVRDLVDSGNQAAAAKITGSMSKEDFSIYKKIKKEFIKETKVEIKDDVQAKLDQVVSLMSQGKSIEARQITAKMSKTEFSLYKELKKEQDIEF